jgi:D-alanyl-lipoteichoic acid acyltransferase DltB (MBOAT superfamily)
MQIMYLVDCYEGMLKPNTLREHALVVSFFPTVTMGPIVRVKNVLTQFRETANKGISLEQLAPGIALFSIGLFKKVVIADSFAIIADIGYGSPSILSMFEGWVTSISYTLQIYFDFSGYSDMAIAIAMMMGIYIPGASCSRLIPLFAVSRNCVKTFLTRTIGPIVTVGKKETTKACSLKVLGFNIPS